MHEPTEPAPILPWGRNSEQKQEERSDPPLGIPLAAVGLEVHDKIEVQDSGFMHGSVEESIFLSF